VNSHGSTSAGANARTCGRTPLLGSFSCSPIWMKFRPLAEFSVRFLSQSTTGPQTRKKLWPELRGCKKGAQSVSSYEHFREIHLFGCPAAQPVRDIREVPAAACAVGSGIAAFSPTRGSLVNSPTLMWQQLPPDLVAHSSPAPPLAALPPAGSVGLLK